MNLFLLRFAVLAIAWKSTAAWKPPERKTSCLSSSYEQSRKSSPQLEYQVDTTHRTEHVCLDLRGGSASGIVRTLIRTALRNPVLLLLMIASSLLVVYEEKVPYAENMQSFIHLCIAGYCFYLLVMWQKMHSEASES